MHNMCRIGTYREWKRAGIFVFKALTICFLLSIWQSNYTLTISHHAISTDKVDTSFRVVLLSDLHNSEFGRDNARLAELVQKQQPDMILLAGDMLNGFETQTETISGIVERLAQIAPTYAAYGNHEYTHEVWYGTDIRTLYENAGAELLEANYMDIQVNGQTVRLGGILGYCLSEKYLSSGEAKHKEIEYLKAFQNTEHFTMLLCHYPLCWIKNDNLEQWDIDSIFAGHAHGGQIRLPIVGGIYAPDHGMFPGQLSGLYYSQDRERVMILTRGLGGRSKLPRLNNVPEIVVVDILPQMK